MRIRCAHQAVLGILLVCQFSVSLATETPDPNESSKYLNAVRTFFAADGGGYYVATGGNDAGPGTMERPLATLERAIAMVKPGETVYVRGGKYQCDKTIMLLESGEQGKPIRVWAYRDEEPIFNVKQGRGFTVRGAYWHLKGLIISDTRTAGLQLEGDGSHHNVIEQLQTHSNGDTGVNLTRGAAHNLVLNCDSYRNFDLPTNGENADGFGAKFGVGQGNTLIGCRAWNNADDGFDCWYAGSSVGMENCYAYRNGQNIWEHPGFTGNANGFKLGQMEGAHIVIRCAAWEHPVRGFDLNGNSTGVTLYNCSALRNRIDYAFTFTKGNIDKNTLRNNLSLGGGIRINPAVNEQHNNWSTPLDIHVTEQDFLSLDDSVITGPRNPDGSIPKNDFLRLAPGSDAIDAGTDVGLPFVGKAPDLGAFEYDPNKTSEGYVKMLHRAVRDHNVKQIEQLLAQGEAVNDKDWLGYAPLHWACYFGYPDLIELLIGKGADHNLISDTGRTPLEIAEAMDYESLTNILRKHGGTIGGNNRGLPLRSDSAEKHPFYRHPFEAT
ncbi:MAG: ankyrin repeat domain-containing protein [Planctomycetes bacterium]|nr:ankyrin repeat domain-containing protein [Planctomycetota bacterium]MBL7185839.1 ankyrin repeat domain-containing protein [Phycisphaerae bacterium]